MNTRFTITTLLCCALHLGFSQDVVIWPSGQRIAGKILDEDKQEVIFQPAGQQEPMHISRSERILLRYDHKPYFPRSVSFEYGVAIAVLEPAAAIKSILEEQGFDDIAENYFWGTTNKYPTTNYYPSVGVAVNYAIAARSELGLAFNGKGANLKGYKRSFGYVNLRYRVQQLIPNYRLYNRYHKSYWEVGLPLAFLKLKEEEGQTATGFQPGLKLGAAVLLSQRKAQGLQLKVSYYFTPAPFEVDPLDLESPYYPFPRIKLFENDPIRYHCLELGLVYGARIWARR